MFFCLPVLFGCQTQIKPDGTQQVARICPRCHNASVFAAKSKTWFEFFFVPIFPLSSKNVWICGICQWQVPIQPGWEPQIAGAPGHHPPGPPVQGWNPPNQPGYQPAYVVQQK
ncbi:hypothetical protein HGRIS_013512 [Hohenbuehelia grisea]|uniref:Zinc-ribbon 15 domain-containing protein n=1 Tax=Hohenbuehelia grisea TaxID=104357 RepID=A0ABR3IVV3_9AGAR